jgi:molybdopterin synthase sulfur carrier subunit
VTLLYFAWVRQRLGTGEERIDLPAKIRTVAQLVELLRQRGGTFADVFSGSDNLCVAVNQEHAKWDAAVAPGDEVAFFPPVTGG